jgi:hypothetical protein
LLTPLVDWASLDSAAVVGISPGCSKLELRYQYEWQQPVYQATTVDDEVPELCCTKTVKMVANLRKTNGGTTLLSTGSVLYVFHPS